MAMKMVKDTQQYIGLSSDPMPQTDIEGTRVHILDTGEQFVMHDRMWERDLRLITALKSLE